MVIPTDLENHLVEKLTDAISQEEFPRRSLVTLFPETTFARNLSVGSTTYEIARSAVDLMLREGWAFSPSWLETVFIRYQLALKSHELKKLFDIIKDRSIIFVSPIPVDPLTISILTNGIPFVDRTPLRVAIRELLTAASQPILIVNGDSKIGKSHSTFFIDHFASINQTVDYYKLEFRPNLGLETGAKEMASDLVFKMGGDASAVPPAGTNTKRYVIELAQLVLSFATKAPNRQAWIILDNFQGKSLRQDAKDFIVELAALIVSGGVFTSRCRLIIINFERGSLTVNPGLINEEVIQHCEEVHINDAVTEICKDKPVSVWRATSWIHENLPNDITKMAVLNFKLRALMIATGGLLKFKTKIDEKLLDFDELLFELLKDLPTADDPVATLRIRLQNMKQNLDNL